MLSRFSDMPEVNILQLDPPAGGNGQEVVPVLDVSGMTQCQATYGVWLHVVL